MQYLEIPCLYGFPNCEYKFNENMIKSAVDENLFQKY